ncbi:MAG: hypothetical protein HY735_29395 [Verrucomicrobia bacterium]|nr:hypothetical protein [Verrucomicrobiota bacterium]
MSDKISASVAGSRLPADARAQTYQFNRQKKSREESQTVAGSDMVVIDASRTRYLDSVSPGRPDVEEAVSFTQTQAAFLGLVGQALDRMGELSVLCQDAAKSDGDRADLTVEFTQLQNFISDIGTKKFSGIELFGGASPKVGHQGESTFVPLNPIHWTGTEQGQGMALAYDPVATEVATDGGAGRALANIREALKNLGLMQAKVAANLQRLNLSGEQLLVLNENLSAANNRINDIDWARKLTEVARFRMLDEANAAQSAQANTSPQTAIRLLNSNG